MKEATGELNLAVIVAIVIGILIAFFFTFIWPLINDNYQRTSNCKKAYCDCSSAKSNDYKCNCWANKSEKESGKEPFLCPWEG